MTALRDFPVKPTWILLAIWTLLLLASVPTRSYIPIDETRYVTVAWNMWLSGDYLVPSLNGLPYHHKPPLLFWLINLGWAVFGVNETWPRILPALFSLANAFLLQRLALLLWPQRRAVAARAPLILMASLLWAVFTTATMFDIMLTAFVLLGLCGVVLAGRNPDNAASTRRGFVLLALALGGGLLAKGPVALLHILLPAIAAPFWTQAWAGRWRAWYGRLGLAFLAGAAIVLAWAIPAAIAGGETYARAIFWGQTAHRMVDAFAHKRPFYWYLPFLPLIFYPWLWLPQVWRGLAQLWRQRTDSSLRFVAVWLLPLFFFFCLISGKQLHYLLPLFPGTALLFALALDGTSASRRAANLIPVIPVVALAMALLADWRIPGLPADMRAPAWLPYVLLLIASFFGVAALRRWRPAVHLAAGSTLVVALLSSAVLPVAMKSLDVRPTARHLAKLEAAGQPLAFVGEYPGIFDFLGRLHKPLDVLLTRQEIRAWCDAHPDGRLVVTVKRKNVPPDAEFVQDYFGERLVVIPPEAHRACQNAPE